MNKEEFVNGWLSHIKRPNYPQKSIDLMNKELDEMILFEAKKLEQSHQADVSGSLPDELLLAAIKYGYDYHSTTSFPNEAFEVNMLGNALQWIENQKQ